jgi:hypothetical protein
MEEYDILAIQKMAMDRRTRRAYCPSLSRYMVVYSSGRAAIYVHRRWNIKTVEAKGGEDWAQVTIGEGAAAVTIWSIYSPIQIGGPWNTPLNTISPGSKSILVEDFNIHHPLWDIYGRALRNSGELAAYMLRWNMELYTPFGEIIRQKHGQRNSIINLAWIITKLLTYYQGNVGLDGLDYRAQFISTYLKAEDTQPHRSKTEGWN